MDRAMTQAMNASMLNWVPRRSEMRNGRPKLMNNSCSRMGRPRTPST